MRDSTKFADVPTAYSGLTKSHSTAVVAARVILVLLQMLTIIASGSAHETTISSSELPLPAFPDAEGFGAYTPGGRGGDIRLVTNLEDNDDKSEVIHGSLREAVEAKGPRIVLFRVSGTIHLKQWLTISEPYITIAGQSAPGDGIC